MIQTITLKLADYNLTRDQISTLASEFLGKTMDAAGAMGDDEVDVEFEDAGLLRHFKMTLDGAFLKH